MPRRKKTIELSQEELDKKKRDDEAIEAARQAAEGLYHTTRSAKRSNAPQGRSYPPIRKPYE